MDSGRYVPNILAFTCSSCSYPAVSLIGLHHLAYPSSVKIVRVPCTGGVDPAFIMKAFEYGADGVALIGCRMDDCRYIDGNKKAKERVEALQKVLRYIGLGEGRLRTEWISASEKTRLRIFERSMSQDLSSMGPSPIPKVVEEEKNQYSKKAIDTVVADMKAHNCVECGKCTSVCPVAKINKDFSPRIIVLKALEGISDSLTKDRDIWECITCEMCNSMCPYEVDYSGFIQGIRTEAVRLGNEPECSQGGLLNSMMRIMTKTEKQDRLGWVPENVKIAEKGDTFFFVGCTPHLDAVFYDRNLNLIQSSISTIKLLNHAGIVPIVSNREVCCGHDLNWAGDNENFEKLMDKNLETVKMSGAKRIVFACPECYRTWKIDYQDIAGDLDYEMMHITELLTKLANEGKINIETKGKDTVTYHDPCRLGRHLGVYDAPRDLLKMTGVEIKEMANNRDKSACCGVSAWLSCGNVAKQMQIERIMEAKGTGAERLLTNCPKCRIHLDCAVSKQTPVDKSLLDIPMEDYITYFADRLGL
ncbi:MAG: hydrogenase iron-sulfur subunit [Methanomassiliicoccales archaeon]|nr:hydrogenase iron-sulfur subunit [Methanomassiliicoccales archaeon]